MRPRCPPTCPWTRSRWHFRPAHATTKTSAASCSTPTPALNTPPSATPRRLADAGALASIGTVGDSYDNALAECVVGLYKTECVDRRRPLRTIDELELATLSWVDWYNTTRLHSSSATSPRSSSRSSTTVRSTPSRNRCRENSPSTRPGAIRSRWGRAGIGW